MTKPMNRFSLVLWILAAAFAAIQLWGVVTVLNAQVDASDFVLDRAPSVLLGLGELMGLAVLIELVDRIRWNATQGDRS